MLERSGMHESHPVLRAALAARDAAAQAHRRGKAPHPVARRMGWAQSKLDRAFRLRDRTLAELAAFDEECSARRWKITEKLEADKARVAKHRDALEELQMEAGAELLSPSRATGGGREACGKAAGSLRDAAPRAIALAQSLPEGSAARGEANLLLADLASLQAQLEQAARDDDGPETFDIGDCASEWSESHELEASGAAIEGGMAEPSKPPSPPRWKAEGHGRWQNGKGRSGPADSASGKGTSDRGAADGLSAPPPPGAPTAPTETSASAPRQESGEQQPPRVIRMDGNAGSSDGGAGGDERAAKHRRGQGEAESAEAAAAAQDACNARELLQQHAAGVAAGFGTPNGVRLAAQQHAKHVDKVVALATEHGVQPVTSDGQDLIMLGPEELRNWAKQHLAGKAEAWW